MPEPKPTEQYHARKSAVRTTKADLPAEFVNILHATRDKFTSASWELADILADMESEWGKPLPRARCAVELGLIASEVSSLILTAQRIAPELRVEYDALSFGAFKYAARDYNPADVLRLYALKSADDYGGSPGSVAVVRRIVKRRKGGGKRDTRRTWGGHTVYIMGRCYILLDVTADNAPLAGAAMTAREVG